MSMTSMWWLTRKRWGWRPSRPTLPLPSRPWIRPTMGHAGHGVPRLGSTWMGVYGGCGREARSSRGSFIMVSFFGDRAGLAHLPPLALLRESAAVVPFSVVSGRKRKEVLLFAGARILCLRRCCLQILRLSLSRVWGLGERHRSAHGCAVTGFALWARVWEGDTLFADPDGRR